MEEPPAPVLSTKDKLAKILDHWIHHNKDHEVSYRQWAQRARSEGFLEVAEALETVAQRSAELNDLLEHARQHLPS